MPESDDSGEGEARLLTPRELVMTIIMSPVALILARGGPAAETSDGERVWDLHIIGAGGVMIWASAILLAHWFRRDYYDPVSDMLIGAALDVHRWFIGASAFELMTHPLLAVLALLAAGLPLLLYGEAKFQERVRSEE